MKKTLLPAFRLILWDWSTLLLFELCYHAAAIAAVRPLFRGLLALALRQAGLRYLSNQNMLRFLCHPAAVFLLVLTALLLAALSYFEMAAVVLYCDVAAHRRRLGPIPLAWAALRRTCSAVRLQNLPLAALVLLLLPLTSFRLSTAPLGSFCIPSFLLDFFKGTPVLHMLLTAAAVGAELLALAWVFAVPDMVLTGSCFWDAVRNSRRMIRGQLLQAGGVLLAGWLLARLAALTAGILGLVFLFGWVQLFHMGPHAQDYFWGGLGLLCPWGRFLAAVFDLAWSFALITVLYHRLNSGRETSPGKGRRPRVQALPLTAKVILILFLFGRYVVSPPDALPTGGGGLFRGPMVIAHRGGSAFAPENTLAALREAITSGAGCAEIDVRLTRDQVPILMHDRSLRRTTGADGLVSETDYAEVRMLDAGGWFSDRFLGEPVPTLEEALRLCEGKIHLMIELKAEGDDALLVRSVTELIRRYGFEDQCIVVSSNHQLLRAVKKTAPDLPVGLIAAVAYGDLSQAAGIDAVSAEVTFASEELVDRLHQNGRPVFFWTVNQEQEMRRTARLGADGIITDNPWLAGWALLPGSDRFLLTVLVNRVFPTAPE